jgi:hypothetical protein
MAWTVTEIVAWWGAILATIVFVWDVIKWRLAGPKLRLTVNTGMKSLNIPEYEGKTLITAEIVNYGDRPTTLTLIAFMHYKNLWNRIRNKEEKSYVVSNPNLHFRIPHELNPGRKWDAVALQNEALEKMAREDYLVCAVRHTHSKRPAKKRIRIK